MSLQVTLTPPGGATVDVTGYLVDGQFELGRSLGEEGARCAFSLVNYPGPVTMAAVLATWDGEPVYRGQVIRRKRASRGSVTFLYPECVDAVSRMNRRQVAQTYQDVAASDIVLDLLSRYMPDVTPSVAAMSAPLAFPFAYVSLLEAVRRVADASGALWLLTADNLFRFFTDYYDAATIPEYGPEQILGDSFHDQVGTTAFANRVWVLGAKQADLNFKTQTFTGDSNVFQLAYEPNYTEVRVNGGNLRVVHLKENRQADTEFLVDKKRKVVEPLITLTSADVVEIRYRPTREIVDYFEDPASIATYGLYETVIKDRTITDKATARQRGRAALRRSSGQRPVFSWRTDAEWQVYPGQRCRVVYPQLGVDQYCRLTDVDISFQDLGHRWYVTADLRGEGL